MPTRPLRRDAERNRGRILDAARELFAERGLDVSMDEIAARAGVGIGTLYRRFAARDELVGALFDERLAEYAALAEAALAIEDDWEAFTTYLERSAELLASDRGLHDILVSHEHAGAQVQRARAATRPLIERLLARARASGRLRADLSPEDLALVNVMLAAVVEFAGGVAPDLWRRYLALLLDGLAGDRAGASDLPVAPLGLEGLDAAMTSWKRRRR